MSEQIQFSQIKVGDRLIVSIAGRKRLGIHVKRVYRFGPCVLEGQSMGLKAPHPDLKRDRWISLMPGDTVERLVRQEVAA